MKAVNDWFHKLLDDGITSKHRSLASRVTLFGSFVKDYELAQLADCIITVTGTNGKGSTVRLLESIYLAAGYRVAALTSPHFIDFGERLRLNGVNIDEALLLEAFERLECAHGDNKVNPFDFLYMALYYCVKQFKPQVAIIEAGIGGRLDLSNILNSHAAVITTIGLDHADFLGDTREDVAFEKAHLARRGCPLICGEPDAPSSLFDVVHRIGANLYQLDSKNNGFSYQSNAGSWNWSGSKCERAELPIPSLKLQNAATALMTIESLLDK